MTRPQRVMMLLTLLVIGAVALGCANRNGGLATPAYEADLSRARARASIAEAQQAGAAQFANAELTLAREKIRAAERAAEDDDHDRAQRLAVEGALDAELAAAMARHRTTEQRATEARSNLRTLAEEPRRSDGGVGVGP